MFVSSVYILHRVMQRAYGTRMAVLEVSSARLCGEAGRPRNGSDAPNRSDSPQIRSLGRSPRYGHARGLAGPAWEPSRTCQTVCQTSSEFRSAGELLVDRLSYLGDILEPGESGTLAHAGKPRSDAAQWIRGRRDDSTRIGRLTASRLARAFMAPAAPQDEAQFVSRSPWKLDL